MRSTFFAKQNVELKTSQRPPQFFERCLENWLRHTTERGYQLPFCQMLIGQGYDVLRISRHGPGEQGKDVIAQDAQGNHHAYQMKQGDLNLEGWRQIKPQIEELIEYTIHLPGIRARRPSFYLVTNGQVADTVISAVNNLNRGRWRKTPLRIIDLPQLLGHFIHGSTYFPANELELFQKFLSLYLSDPRDFIPREELYEFIEGVLHATPGTASPKAHGMAVSAAVLLVGYLLGARYAASNHVACMEALTFLIATLLSFVHEREIPKRVYGPSLELLINELFSMVPSVESECAALDFPRMLLTPADQMIAMARVHTSVSYLIAGKLGQYMRGEAEWSSVRPDSHGDALSGYHAIIGEGSLTRHFLQFWYYTLLAGDDEALAEELDPTSLLELAIEQIIENNVNYSTPRGLPSPYYSIEDVLLIDVGAKRLKGKEEFKLSSYFIRPLIHLMVRAGERERLNELWRGASKLGQVSVIPDSAAGFFAFRTEDADVVQRQTTRTASWAKLSQEAHMTTVEYKEAIESYPEFLPFFFLAYPHRCFDDAVLLLDSILLNR